LVPGLQAPLKVKVLIRLGLLFSFVAIILVTVSPRPAAMTEEQKAKYERLKAVRGGHRDVTTKLIRETDEFLATTTLSSEGRTRLDVIHKPVMYEIGTVIRT